MKIAQVEPGEEIIKPYTDAIFACGRVQELIAVLEDWRELCPDALAQARTLPDDATWQWVLRHKRQKRHVKRVSEVAGAILIPETLVWVGLIAAMYQVPDGCALNRLQEMRERAARGY